MKSRIAILAAGLCLSAAVPAFADFDNIGQVDVGFKADRDARNLDLGGPVERLQLSAARSDVYCNAVTASFGSGNSKRVYQGFIRQGHSVNVDMPGVAVDLNRLVFNCAAQGRSGATIRIGADIGRYRDTWRRNPNFSRLWARMFNWTNNPPPPSAGWQGNRPPPPPPGGGWQGGRPPGAMMGPAPNWQLMGSESFEGRNDSETSFTGWNGRRANRIGLSPVGADAQCSRVQVRFGSGRTVDLPRSFTVMHPGQVYGMDLPGQVHDVRAVNMRCHALNNYRVTIQIFTR